LHAWFFPFLRRITHFGSFASAWAANNRRGGRPAYFLGTGSRSQDPDPFAYSSGQTRRPRPMGLFNRWSHWPRSSFCIRPGICGCRFLLAFLHHFALIHFHDSWGVLVDLFLSFVCCFPITGVAGSYFGFNLHAHVRRMLRCLLPASSCVFIYSGGFLFAFLLFCYRTNADRSKITTRENRAGSSFSDGACPVSGLFPLSSLDCSLLSFLRHSNGGGILPIERLAQQRLVAMTLRFDSFFYTI
jgi:hypothetical protein